MTNILKLGFGNRSFATGFVITCLIVLMAVLSFLWTPYDVTDLDIASKLKTPGRDHWFGTDHFGRDIFSMVMWAPALPSRWR